jgi:hypothetical protein
MLHTTLFCSKLKINSPFLLFSIWSSKILTNLPNLIIYLIIRSLEITKINKFRPPNPAISLAITLFFSHLHTSVFNTLYVLVHYYYNEELSIGLQYCTKVHKDGSVDRPMSKHLQIQRRLNSHTLFLACETQIIFVGLHLYRPFNITKIAQFDKITKNIWGV